MARDEPVHRMRPTVGEVALPGHHPCITLQLNVTRYQSEKRGRMVLILRDPEGNTELRRHFVHEMEWVDVASSVQYFLEGALEEMAFLQDGYNNS